VVCTPGTTGCIYRVANHARVAAERTAAPAPALAPRVACAACAAGQLLWGLRYICCYPPILTLYHHH
jgi:hypothetical protein